MAETGIPVKIVSQEEAHGENAVPVKVVPAGEAPAGGVKIKTQAGG